MREDLVALEGISQVSMEYVRPDEISIEVSENTLRAYGLTLNEVARAIRRVVSRSCPVVQSRQAAVKFLYALRDRHTPGGNSKTLLSSRDKMVQHCQLLILQQSLTVLRKAISAFASTASQLQWSVYFALAKKTHSRFPQQVNQYIEEARSRLPEGIEITLWRDSSLELARTP